MTDSTGNQANLNQTEPTNAKVNDRSDFSRQVFKYWLSKSSSDDCQIQ